MQGNSKSSKIQGIFRILDADSDGRIDRHELEEWVKGGAPALSPLAVVDRVCSVACPDEQFVDNPSFRDDGKKYVQSIMDVLDKDRNGTINSEELARLFATASISDIDEVAASLAKLSTDRRAGLAKKIFEALDADRDGQVDKKEVRRELLLAVRSLVTQHSARLCGADCGVAAARGCVPEGDPVRSQGPACKVGPDGQRCGATRFAPC